MIDLAVIASRAHLDQLSARGSIDMALTHLVLDHPAYAAYYRARAEAGITVMLDNSAYELETETGQGMSAVPVLNAAAQINASVVVCQDVLYDGPTTVAATEQFLIQAADIGAGPYRFMGVPQGRTRTEWLVCYDRLAAMPGVDMIGLSKLSVPRCFDAPVAEARLACVDQLFCLGIPKPLHLLGGDRRLPWELTEHRRRSHDDIVRSHDSSFAYWYAACAIPVDATAGQAAAEAPTKPELVITILDGIRLATALEYVTLLRRAAGLNAF
ncbi:MAG: hypothetical protein ACRDYA_21555 [Egibacteraceae bacterium]